MVRFACATLSFLTAGLMALSVGGCNIAGPAAYLIEGPPSADAEIKLPDVPTVVFVDDRQNVVNPVSMRRVIADKVSQDLMEKKVLTKTISSQDAMTLAVKQERHEKIMSIEEIGRAVGAKQVIYIQMLQFVDLPNDFTPRPTAVCQVKVIDVENRERIFPPLDADEEARLVQTATFDVQPAMYTTRNSRLKVFEMLAQAVGSDVGKLFYKHEIRELGGHLNPR